MEVHPFGQSALERSAANHARIIPPTVAPARTMLATSGAVAAIAEKGCRRPRACNGMAGSHGPAVNEGALMPRRNRTNAAPVLHVLSKGHTARHGGVQRSTRPCTGRLI